MCGNVIIQDINWKQMYKHRRPRCARAFAEFWSASHIISVVRPAGASPREVWNPQEEFTSGSGASTSPLCSQKPARLHLTSLHIIVVIPDRCTNSGRFFSDISQRVSPDGMQTHRFQQDTGMLQSQRRLLWSVFPPPDLSHCRGLYLGTACLRGKVTQNS